MMKLKGEMCDLEMYVNEEKTEVVIKQTFSRTQVAEFIKGLEALFEADPLGKHAEFPLEALEFLRSATVTEH